MEMIYTYLTGPRFRLRVEALAEAFPRMSEDLFKENKTARCSVRPIPRHLEFIRECKMCPRHLSV